MHASPILELDCSCSHDQGTFEEGLVVARPSARIRSPFLADVRLTSGEVVICHSPSLGCCGLIVPGALVKVALRQDKGKQTQARARSSHVIYQVEVKDPSSGIIHSIGTHPLIANRLAYAILHEGLLEKAGVPKMTKMKSEVQVPLSNSRFDLTGIGTDGKMWICEVKNVPLADYIDGTSKQKRQAIQQGLLDYYDWHEKIAMFPDGFKSMQVEPVSARALKHVRKLADIAYEGVYRTLLLFVVQRVDCRAFTITKMDPTYRAAVIEAKQLGVQVRAVAIHWDGPVAYFMGEIPVLL